MQIKGLIQGVSRMEGIGKAKGKPYVRWEFLIDGKKYSTFDEKIGDAFKQGQTVLMNGEQDGQYFNMKTMEEDSASPTPAPTPEAPATGLPSQNQTFAESTIPSQAVEILLVEIIKQIKILNSKEDGKE